MCAHTDTLGDRYGVAALSDVYSNPGLHARSAGAEYFRDFATNHALQTSVLPRSKLVFCRSGRDFTDQDRLTLGLLRPHLGAAFAPTSQPANLTVRQRQVLALVADGHTNNEIAARLSLAPGTVRKHLDNIYARLDVPNRAAAISRSLTEATAPACRRSGRAGCSGGCGVGRCG